MSVAQRGSAAVVVLALTACGGGSSDNGDDPVVTPLPAASSCFNPALQTAGTALDTVTRATYPIGTAALTEHAVVGGMTTFNGVQARQAAETFAFVPDAALIAAGQLASTTTGFRYYTADSSAASLRDLGATATSAGATVSLVNSPYIESRFNLAPGASFSQAYTQVQTATSGGVAQTTTYAYVKNVQFSGIVSVTVPAGTFESCQFVETGTVSTNGGAAMSTGTSTNWIGVNNGVVLKTVSVTQPPVGVGSTSTFELLSGTINGASLPH